MDETHPQSHWELDKQQQNSEGKPDKHAGQLTDIYEHWSQC